MLHATELGGAGSGAARGSLALDTAPIVLPASAPAPAVRSISGRPAGAADIRRCLDAQSREPEPTALARVLGRDPLAHDARAAFAAAVDAGRVAAVLARLPEWTVLHSLPIGPGDADLAHLALGAAGAVVLVVRPSGGGRVWASGETFLGAGRPEPVLRRALELREDVASRLSVALGREVPVAAAVVLTGDDRVVVADRTDAPVLLLSRLEGWLAHLPETLSPREADALVAAAERADTWRDRASTELSDPAERRAFTALVARVRRARRRRTAWELGGAAALCGIAVASGLPTLLVEALALR